MDMIKKCDMILTIFLLAALTVSCGQTSGAQSQTALPQQRSETESVRKEIVCAETADNRPKEAGPEAAQSSMAAVYISALEGIYYDALWPDGTMFSLTPPAGGGASADFAVYDIDFDGQDELIIEHSDTVMAGMVTVVYGYDENTGRVFEEFFEFPSIRFYDNGIVEADWSHNQDPASADDFWPYPLYQYNPQTDSYTHIASVHAQDMSRRRDKISSWEKADTDGDGILFFIIQEGVAYEDGLQNPVDLAEYRQWHDSYINGAEQITVPFLPIDYKNIYTAFGKPLDREKYDHWQKEWEAQFKG